MANTENIEAKLCAYVDGELDAAGRAEIEAHLEANPQHRQLMQELMGQRQFLRDLPRAGAPEDLLESVQSQLERSVLLGGGGGGSGGGGGAAVGGAGAHEVDEHVIGRINPWPRVFGVAAVLVLALGLASVIFLMIPRQPGGANFAITGGAITGGPATSAPTDGSVTRADLSPVATPSDRTFAGGKSAAEALVPPATADGFKLPDAAVAPAIPPSTPGLSASAGSIDPFDKSPAVVLAPEGKSARAADMLTNVFKNVASPIDAVAVEEKLKQTGGVANNSMLVLVNADDPSAANRQVQDFLSNNKIRWEAVSEPMPQPLDLREGQVMRGARSQNVQMRLKEGSPTDAAQQQAGSLAEQTPAGVVAGGGESGGADGPAQPQPPASPAPEAQSQPPAREPEADADRLRSVAAGGAQAKAPAPPAAAPPAAAEARDFSKSAGSAGDEKNRTLAPDVSMAEKSDAPNGAATSPNESAALADASKKKEDAAAQQSQESALQKQQAAPAPSPLPGAAPPFAEAVQPQQQVAQNARQLANGQSQANAAPLTHVPGGDLGVPQQQQQFMIARGLTQQQVVELYTCVNVQNSGRVAAYQRGYGGNYTPTTLPAMPNTAGALTLNHNLTGVIAATQPAGAATHPSAVAVRATGDAIAKDESTPPTRTTQPAATQSAVTRLAATQPAATGAAIRTAATQPSRAPAATAPAGGEAPLAVQPDAAPADATAAPAPTADVLTATTRPADDSERVDVVIVLQTEPSALQQRQQQRLQQVEQAVQSQAQPPAEPDAAAGNSNEAVAAPAPTTAPASAAPAQPDAPSTPAAGATPPPLPPSATAPVAR